MGLIMAAVGSVRGSLEDGFKEFFSCSALDSQTLVRKGVRSSRGSNRGDDNIITDGSVIVVADGQCALIVENGKIVDVAASPGSFIYDSGSQPSFFVGSLSGAIKEIYEQSAARFQMGGLAGKDQRLYYFNTKEILGNKYGTKNPVPFRVTDENIGLDIDISVRCYGEFSYKITNPALFYANVCGNVAFDYGRDKIDSQLRSELMTALQPAFARLSALGLRYSSLPAHTQDVADTLNSVLSDKWRDLRGLEIASFGINSITASKEDEDLIKVLQRAAVLRDPQMAQAALADARNEALKNAAKNANGAPIAIAALTMGERAASIAAPQQPNWICSSCQTANTGKFCMECAKPRPGLYGWNCPKCSTMNQGRFCMECAEPKPVSAPTYRCDKCGWVPEDPFHAPNFCPECGDPFDDADIIC